MRHSFKSIDFTAEVFSENCNPIKNPYCGFYHIVRYTLSDDYLQSDSLLNEVASYTEPLVLIEINLKNYRKSEISEKGLTQLKDILNCWSQSDNNTKLILRFLYDWDGIAKATEPDSLNIVLTHIEQVSEYINQNRNSVYIMQGVFIGNWGEIHSSKFSDFSSLKTLIDRLNEVIDPSVYLSIRTPSQWRAVTELQRLPKKFQAVKDKSLISRLGLFNDGILGSESDLGTYQNSDGICSRHEELEFQNRLCRFVPNGGEVVYNHNLSDIETAVTALKAMHISYLNAEYDARVLEKWKNSVWVGNDVFNGSDGYSYIKAHLGYRYVIENCKIKKSGLLMPRFTLYLTIKNNGFSNILKPLEAYVTLINSQTGERISLSIKADFTQLFSGGKKTFTAKLPVKELKDGEYLIYFSLKDKSSGQTVFLGNKNEITKNGYLLGQIEK